jgi:uncharacterized protein involved in exopolysaccharide biosynthesis
VLLDHVSTGQSIAQWLVILRAYRAVIVAIVAAVLALTALALVLWPRTYTATASIMVNYEVNDPLNGKDLPVGQVGSFIATQVELMQTPELLLTVVDHLGLVKDPEYSRGYVGERGTLRDWAAAQVARSLAVFQSQRGSQLIYVTCSAADPLRAAELANAVIDVYRDEQAERAAGPPNDRARQYSAQLAGLKAKVDQAQQKLTDFHQRHALLDAGGRANVDNLQMVTLNERLLAAQIARRAAEARASGDIAASDEVLASNPAQALKAQLGTQEQRLAQLNRLYMPAHPDVLDAQTQVETTRRAIALTIRSYGDNAQANRTVAVQLEQGLQRAAEEQRGRMLARSQLDDEAAKSRLELESAQVVYRRALEAYDPMLFLPQVRHANVSAVSRATTPPRASKPRLLAGLAAGGLVALTLGFGLPLLWELSHRRVRCRDDLERHHGVPVLVEFGRFTGSAA